MKRFYELSTVGETSGGFEILLDGRAVKTPAKAALVIPSRRLAEALALEWNAQGEKIDPETMPFTRLANTAIDRVQGREKAVVNEIAAYGGSDLICYRAERPDDLVAAQARAWDPYVAWAKTELNASLRVTAGIVHVTQPEVSVANICEHVAAYDAYGLSALHTLTTVMGSVVLALAIEKDPDQVENVWRAADAEDAYQLGRWGEDAEAMKVRQEKHQSVLDAAHFLSLLEHL